MNKNKIIEIIDYTFIPYISLTDICTNVPRKQLVAICEMPTIIIAYSWYEWSCEMNKMDVLILIYIE